MTSVCLHSLSSSGPKNRLILDACSAPPVADAVTEPTLPQRYHELLTTSVAASTHGPEFVEAAAAHPSSVVGNMLSVVMRMLILSSSEGLLRLWSSCQGVTHGSAHDDVVRVAGWYRSLSTARASANKFNVPVLKTCLGWRGVGSQYRSTAVRHCPRMAPKSPSFHSSNVEVVILVC